MRQLTMEQIEKLYDDPEEKPDIYYSEIDSLGRWADSKGTHPMQKLYYAIVTSYVLGVKRGKAYEKRQRRKRSRSSLSVESEKEA